MGIGRRAIAGCGAGKGWRQAAIPSQPGAGRQAYQIDDASVALWGDENVRGFQVAVHEACLVKRCQGGSNLVHQDLESGAAIRGRRTSPKAPRVERFPVDPLGDLIPPRALSTVIEQCDQTGVRRDPNQTRKCLRFKVRSQIHRHQLDRYRYSSSFVDRAPDDAHPALMDLLDEFEFPDMARPSRREGGRDRAGQAVVIIFRSEPLGLCGEACILGIRGHQRDRFVTQKKRGARRVSQTIRWSARRASCFAVCRHARILRHRELRSAALKRISVSAKPRHDVREGRGELRRHALTRLLTHLSRNGGAKYRGRTSTDTRASR